MKNQCLTTDRISRLPEDIMEMILTLMPIRDAVRTSILSTKWRYKWIKIPKLVFDHKFFDGLTADYQMSKGHKFLYAVSQVFSQHQGLILEFTLDTHRVQNSNCEIDLIILLLSRDNTLKKFTFSGVSYTLPSSFYSLQQLSHLNLTWCDWKPPSTFNGFNMLTSLCLYHVIISFEMLILLLSGCPILKHLALLPASCNFGFEGEDSIVQFFKCLNVIERLNLNLSHILSFFTGRIPLKLPTSLIHLKHLDLPQWCLMSEHDFRFALLLIRSSPNLEKIKTEIHTDEDRIEGIIDSLVLQDYVDVRLDHLIEFEIINYNNSNAEMELLKLVLVNSPMLKKVHLRLDLDFARDKGKIKMLRSLKLLPRASRVAKITVQ